MSSRSLTFLVRLHESFCASISQIFDRGALIFTVDVATEGLVADITEFIGLSIGYNQIG